MKTRTKRQPPAPKVILTCTGRGQHEWLHDTSNLFTPQYCIRCGQPYSIRTRPAE